MSISSFENMAEDSAALESEIMNPTYCLLPDITEQVSDAAIMESNPNPNSILLPSMEELGINVFSPRTPGTTEEFNQEVHGTLPSSPTTDPQSPDLSDFKRLHEEVDTLRWELHQERIAREVVSTVSLRADKSLAKVLADAWQVVDDEKEAHLRTAEDAANAMKDCEYYRVLYEQSEQERTKEMISTQEAMRAVHRAQAKCNKIREENELILDQLVKVKLEYANKCMEYDDLEKSYNDIQRLYLTMLARNEMLESGQKRLWSPVKPEPVQDIERVG